MPEKPPADIAEHAQDFARRWADRLDEYCAIRTRQLGIPDDKNGAPDFDRDGKWRAFDWRSRGREHHKRLRPEFRRA